MAAIDFAGNAGSSVAYDPGDTLEFDASFNAGDLEIVEDSGNLVFTNAGTTVTLLGVTLATLSSTDLVFLDGSQAFLNENGVGTGLGDYFDLRASGQFNMSGGSGEDEFYAGDQLDALDQINGGGGADQLTIEGSTTVVFTPTTVVGVETFELRSGSIDLTIADETVSGNIDQTLTVEATGLSSGNVLTFDASAVTGGHVVVHSGAADDVVTGSDNGDAITGGEGRDTISGGGGADVITGGLGGDTLSGGAGNDRFVFELPTPRSDSSPITPDDIDVITDFSAGDLIDLPNFANSLPLVFNPNPDGDGNSYGFALTVFGADGVQEDAHGGDGLIDVLWQHTGTGVELWVDANDDGQFSEGDLFVILDGATSLTEANFAQTFPAWRGTQGDDSRDGDANPNIFYGLGGADTLNGFGNVDQISGGTGNDTIDGGTGSDTLNGGADDDAISGGDQNDAIYGGQGDDTLDGGDGDDILHAEYDPVTGGGDGVDAINTLSGGLGMDQLFGGAGHDTLNGNESDDLLRGGENSDTLNGGDDEDTLEGDGGDDILNGGADDDTLTGGAGVDQLTGGTGADVFRFVVSDSSNAAADTITDFNRANGDRIELIGPVSFGGPFAFRGEFTGTDLPGQDLGSGFAQVWWKTTGTGIMLVVDINGDYELSGADFVVNIDGISDLQASDFVDGTFVVLTGTPGDDTNATLSGTVTADADIIFGVGGNDTLDGLAGGDQISGGIGDDTLDGGLGTDTLNGGADNDTLNSGDDNDTLYGGEGDDTLDGGDGDDILHAEYDPVTGGGDGVDAINTLSGGLGMDQLFGGAGHDTLNGNEDDDLLRGGENSDTLNGGDDEDTLEGDGGDDILNGGADDDTLTGGAGVDQLTGGTGADVFRFVVADSSNAAADTITDFNRANGDKIELIGPVSFGGPFAFRGEATGTDLPTGDFGSGFAQIWWKAVAGGVDLIVDIDDDGELADTDFVVHLPGLAELQASDFAAGTFVVLTGTGGNDTNATLSGLPTAGDDIIFGLGGDDDLDGLDGADQISGGIGDDTLVGGLGADTLNGDDDDDTLSGDDGIDTLYGGSGGDTLNGGNDADVLHAEYDPVTGGGDAVDDENTLNGGAGNDQLFGGLGIDTLNGGTDDDLLRGGDNADVLNGNDGVDTLEGDAGDDTLDGGAGIDTIGGGLGIDQLTGGGEGDVFRFIVADSSLAAADTITDFNRGAGDRIELISPGFFGGPFIFRGETTGTTFPGEDLGDGFAQVWWRSAAGGVDLIVDTDSDGELTSSDFLVHMSGIADLQATDFVAGTFVILHGTSGDDTNATLSGPLTTGPDIVFALGGADVINGLAGDDQLYGNDGNDTLTGEAGVDILNGGNDNDTLSAGDGADTLYGGGGDDTLNGGNDADILHAAYEPQFGGGDATTAVNTLNGGAGNDQLHGGVGFDTLNGGADDDTLFGAENDDVLNGNEGTDTLNGGSGNDTLDGGTLADTLTGGEDDDTYITDGLDTLVEFADQGIDTVRSQLTFTLAANFENLVLLGAGTINGTGNGADNELTGNGAANSLTGLAGDDTLDGGGGADTLAGGDDDDTYVTDGLDTIVEAVGEGIDTVRTDVTFTLGTNLENLVLLGGGAINGTGNTEDNEITGNGAANVIDGLGGLDTMIGGDGNDTYTADLATDVVTETNATMATGGDDLVNFVGAAGTFTLGANVERLTLGGTSAINGTGNGLANTITGNGAANVIDGLGGLDTMIGGDGNDTYTADLATDVVTETNATMATGGDDLVNFVGAAGTFTLGANVERLTLGGAAAINGTGNGLANTITGNGAANVIDGLGGLDTMIGGDGNDTYTADLATDVVTETNATMATGGDDLVNFVGAAGTFTLGANVERLTLGGAAAINGTGNTLANVLTGNGAANVLNSGVDALADTLIGNDGNDTYDIRTGDIVQETNAAAAGGTDLVNFTATAAGQTYTLTANVEKLTLAGALASNGTGNTLANVLTGNGAANVLNSGVDTLVDTLIGGDGNDTYAIRTGDIVQETNAAAAGGSDLVNFTATAAGQTYTLTANVEKLTLAGALASNGTGNTLANVLTGNGAANVLNSGVDTLVDTLIGGDGNDTYDIRTGDIVQETNAAAAGGTDLVNFTATAAGQTYTLTANVEKLTLAGALASNGTGNTLANVLTGNGAANVLNSGVDTLVDTLIGGDGNDTYAIRTGDIVQETNAAAAGGSDLVNFTATAAGQTYTLTANVEKLTLAGALASNGTGNALANVLTGNGAANVLNGGLGNDTLTGGAGNDIFLFNSAPNSTTNRDTISDFNAAADTIQLENTGAGLFNALAAGVLAAGAYAENTTGLATSASHRIIYETDTGKLWYDSNGSVAAGVITNFATLVPNLQASLSNADFVVI